MRAKRFGILPGNVVDVFLETQTSNRIEGSLVDCSMSGLALRVDSQKLLAADVSEGVLLPTSKLVWDTHEYALGRVVIRWKKVEGNFTVVGLSTVDNRVPLHGALSKKLKFANNETGYDFELSPTKFNLASFVETTPESTDLFLKCNQYFAFAKEHRKSDLYFFQQTRTASKGNRINLKRTRKGNRHDYIMIASNDYLGLSSHPEVIEASKKALDEYGVSSTGSAIATGQTDLHEELCYEIARMFKKPRAILFNSGYDTNVGALPALAGPSDFFAADIMSHASIYDGLRMANCKSRFFKHNDLTHLTKLLDENRKDHAGAMIITEGVYSMDGDVAPIDKIVKIAEEYKCKTFVDEAHSIGVIGKRGLGVSEKQGVLDQVDMIMGATSKFAGAGGGFIATSAEVVEWLYSYGRSRFFSVNLAPCIVAAALKGIQIFQRDPSLLSNLQRNIEHFKQGLIKLNIPVHPNHESAVFPVVIGDEAKLGIMMKYLAENGVFVLPVTYPAVSRKMCRFRFALSSVLTLSDLDYVLNVLEQAIEVAKVEFQGEAFKRAA